MTDESVVWTVLPNGLDDDGRLKATVFVSPRLSTGGGSRPLRDFPTFAAWPTALRELKFEVVVDGVGSADATVDDRIAAPDPDTWELVFGGDVGVIERPFAERDLSRRRVRSFPADEVAQHVLGLYEAIALDDPGAFPPVTTGPLRDLADEIGGLPDERASGYKRLDALFDGEASQIAEGRRGRYLRQSSIPTGLRRRMAFTQAQRFYDRFLNGASARPEQGPIDPGAVPDPPKPPELDFHTYLSALGDYPFLLRKLGIAIDLLIDPQPAFVGDKRIRLLLAGNPQPWMVTEAARPWLNYELRERFFLPRPRRKEREIRDGQLNLPSDFFAVHQIDIDGSALKTIHVAQSAQSIRARITGRAESMAPDEISLPALRTTGFTIVKRDRAVGTVDSFDHAVQHDQAQSADQPADLFAEDVTRGYRVDVDVRQGREFRSQCLRVGDYVLQRAGGDVPIDVPPDEGYVKGSSTTAVPGDEELYLHEAVASWGGWSLVAKRPGQHVSRDEQLEDEPTEPDPGLPLVTSFRPARGSLTRLRYGRPYRFRVLLVDLAGNSVDRRIIDDSMASVAQPFYRWEPVNAPAVVPRRAFSEGESQLRMVIRSTLGMATGTYLALPRISGLAGHDDPDTAYLDHNDRWLVAPNTSQQMAEWHGMFDGATFDGASAAAVDEAFAVASRESGQLAPTLPDETASLPYLPDVSSRGAALTVLPNDPAGSTRRISWPVDDPAASAWWDRQPVRLRVVEGPAPAPVTPTGAPVSAHWDDQERMLTVFLPQAEMVTVQVASAVDAADLELQGMWARVKASLTPAQRAAAADSGAWMFTPWHDLTLVHAVEKPLLAPVVDVPQSGMQRRLGETFCALVGTIDNHAKSTGRLDVEASWSEQVDDPSNASGPEDGEDGRPLRHSFGHVGDFTLLATEDDCHVGRDDVRPMAGQPAQHKLRHELGDTKHRVVQYRSTATTRFREYFPPQIDAGIGEDGVRLIEHPGPSVIRHVPSSRRPEPPEIEYVIPTWGWTETTRTGPRLGGRRGLVVARPSVTTLRTRTGGGLRVYLKRGWYSSGDGELLGVVLTDQPWLTWPIDLNAGLVVSEAARVVADQAAQRLFDRQLISPKGQANLAATERLVRGAGLTNDEIATASTMSLSKLAAGLQGIEAGLFGIIGQLLAQGIDPDKLVTHWGRDPLWGAALPAGGPFIHQFPLRTAVGTQLSLQETTKASVTVVGHTPRYDPTRGLWYCDIQVDAGSSYTPFVRLALCRYQPWSIDGAHLSRVVLADFAQLLPERQAAFTRRAGAVSVSVTGPGSYTSVATRLTSAPNGPVGDGLSRRMGATIQRLRAGADPDLGWVDAGDEVTLAPTTTGGLGAVNWAGTVPVPDAPAGTTQRVLVREYELLETDHDPEDPLGATRLIQSGPVEFPTVANIRQRVVYADTYPL